MALLHIPNISEWQPAGTYPLYVTDHTWLAYKRGKIFPIATEGGFKDAFIPLVTYLLCVSARHSYHLFHASRTQLYSLSSTLMLTGS